MASVFNSEFITNTIFRKSFYFRTVCWGDSFEFLLQAYDLPDSGCVLPELKALLQFGHWILFIPLLHWRLQVPAALSFYCYREELLIRSTSSQKSGFLWSMYPYWCCALVSFWAKTCMCITPAFCQWLDSLIGACYVANGFLVDEGD